MRESLAAGFGYIPFVPLPAWEWEHYMDVPLDQWDK